MDIARTKLLKNIQNQPKTVKRVPAWYFKRVVRSAGKRELAVSITRDYLQEVFDAQGGRCALSGKVLYFCDKDNQSRKNLTNASLDRINNNIGYEKGNLQWVTKDINFLKRSFSQKKLIELCKSIAFWDGKKSGRVLERNDGDIAISFFEALICNFEKIDSNSLFFRESYIYLHFPSLYFYMCINKDLSKNELLKLLKRLNYFHDYKTARYGGKVSRYLVFDTIHPQTPSTLLSLKNKLRGKPINP